jgi:hypothetical protein
MQPGDPVPDNLEDVLKSIQADLEDNTKVPVGMDFQPTRGAVVDIKDLPADKQKQIRDALAQAKQISFLQENANSIPNAAPGVNEAIAAAREGMAIEIQMPQKTAAAPPVPETPTKAPPPPSKDSQPKIKTDAVIAATKTEEVDNTDKPETEEEPEEGTEADSDEPASE